MFCLVGFLLVSCTHNVYPVTTGSHAQTNPYGTLKDPYVVWSNDPRVTHYITSVFLRVGYPVVERARLQQIFDEQRITLLHTPEDVPTILRVGQLLGARYVIFAEAEITPPRQGYSTEGYLVTVVVRNVQIETGEVKWSGTAYFPERINSPDSGVLNAARWAIERATCPVETESVWHDPPIGCKKRGKN